MEDIHGILDLAAPRPRRDARRAAEEGDDRQHPPRHQRAGAKALHALAARADGPRAEPEGEDRRPQEGRLAHAQHLPRLHLRPPGRLASGRPTSAKPAATPPTPSKPPPAENPSAPSSTASPPRSSPRSSAGWKGICGGTSCGRGRGGDLRLRRTGLWLARAPVVRGFHPGVTDLRNDAADATRGVPLPRNDAADLGSGVADVPPDMTDLRNDAADATCGVPFLRNDAADLGSGVADVPPDVADLRVDATDATSGMPLLRNDVADLGLGMADVPPDVADLGNDATDVPRGVPLLRNDVAYSSRGAADLRLGMADNHAIQGASPGDEANHRIDSRPAKGASGRKSPLAGRGNRTGYRSQRSRTGLRVCRPPGWPGRLRAAYPIWCNLCLWTQGVPGAVTSLSVRPG